MRVLQLIDSLHPGGAERMAVTLANSLCGSETKSFLCTTREEGALKESLLEEVGYLFLERKKTMDTAAYKRLRSFVRENKITIIHAHGTSYFMATWLKVRISSLKIIWHEHYGNRIYTKRKDFKMLFFCSYFFDTIFTVSKELENWCKTHLKAKKVVYLPNFVMSSQFCDTLHERDKTIVCLANLRHPKNHIMLLQVVKQIHCTFPNWKLLCVGADYEDAYSEELKSFLTAEKLENHVSFLGKRMDVAQLLQKASIGVLTSATEGLPMALLEYGAAGLAVVVTDVGYCKEVVKDNGKVVAVDDVTHFVTEISKLMENETYKLKMAVDYQQHILNNYTEQQVVPILRNYYKNTD